MLFGPCGINLVRSHICKYMNCAVTYHAGRGYRRRSRRMTFVHLLQGCIRLKDKDHVGCAVREEMVRAHVEGAMRISAAAERQ